MISKNLEKAINEQINREFFSAYLYLSMAQNFEAMNLKGAANWMYKQYKEELTHAEKLIEYLNEVGGRVVLEAIEKPKTEWSSLLEAFEDTYKHEVFISQNIHKLMELAIAEKDFPTQNMLQWFVKEQVEEEEQTLYIVNLLKMVKDSVHGLIQVDMLLGKRE
ncbi:MAG: ferritin [Dictyoglomus sp. NZ13-RE01]|nr:MAG: ferritin [Dictyoglomus sp. NZ13-RE01]